MRILLLLLCLLPSLCRAQTLSRDEFVKQLGPRDTVVVESDKTIIKTTGPGGVAVGDKATLDQSNMKPPQIVMPWGSAMGGSADSSLSAAASVYGSTAFRWVAGIVGLLALVGGFLIGRQGNIRGALIVGGSGVGLLVGTIFFPEWLELGLLAFFAFNVVEYAYAHGLITGTLASVVTGLHNAAAGANTSIQAVIEPAEARLLNKVAKANDATSVRVQA